MTETDGAAGGGGGGVHATQAPAATVKERRRMRLERLALREHSLPPHLHAKDTPGGRCDDRRMILPGRGLLVAILGPFTVVACGSAEAGPGPAGPPPSVPRAVAARPAAPPPVPSAPTASAKRPPKPAPVVVPGDPVVVQYNVERVNAIRAEKGLPPYAVDAKLTAFAHAGSVQLANDHVPHKHFGQPGKDDSGFGKSGAENQGDPYGVYEKHADPLTNGKMQVDYMLKLMMDEGPGGGHHDTIISKIYTRMGVGIVYADGRMFMTNDFSD